MTYRTPLVALAACFVATAAFAQMAPHALSASPDIYKVIAENDQYRVMEVTWKPGQIDKLHSHPSSAVYYVTDCKLKSSTPYPIPALNAQSERTAGSAAVNPPIPAHDVQNVGTADCRLIMFERIPHEVVEEALADIDTLAATPA